MNVKLKNIFRFSQYELKSRLSELLKINGYNPVFKDGFLYAEGELPVLLVAHLDTVHKELVREIVYCKNGREISSPQGIGGDDRCGVFMILKIIKELRCHVLFCEDEEIGGIGAEKFAESGITPDVNFIIEMDRRGSNDAVFYDCENEDFTKFITSFGFSEEWGSFSDISVIAPALGVAAVNISAGYYNEHTLKEYVDIEVMRINIERIKKIIRASKQKYEYIEKDYGYYDHYYGREYKSYGYLWDGWFGRGCSYNKQKTEIINDILANKIEDLWGFVISEDGELFDSDVYIGADNKVYIEYEDGIYICLMGARAFNCDGGHLRYHEECPSYQIYISDMVW